MNRNYVAKLMSWFIFKLYTPTIYT